MERRADQPAALFFGAYFKVFSSWSPSNKLPSIIKNPEACSGEDMHINWQQEDVKLSDMTMHYRAPARRDPGSGRKSR